MKQTRISFESLNINPTIYFLGTDEEIEAAERKEAARAAELEKVIFSSDFLALELRRENGAREILHHSTRKGVFLQLSYIAADGVPTMHENFIKTDQPTTDGASVESKEKLLLHFINATLRTDRTFELLTA